MSYSTAIKERTGLSEINQETTMSAQWTYDNGIAYADGTGTYEKGWYAATPLTAEAGAAPEEGPFKTRAQAEKKAAALASEDDNA